MVKIAEKLKLKRQKNGRRSYYKDRETEKQILAKLFRSLIETCVSFHSTPLLTSFLTMSHLYGVSLRRFSSNIKSCRQILNLYKHKVIVKTLLKRDFPMMARSKQAPESRGLSALTNFHETKYKKLLNK